MTPEGVLNIDKPSGWTSHDAVAKLRGALQAGKIGHAGTLDPAATGVLVICVGKATKIVEYLVGLDKVYEATLFLGSSTDTQDGEGKVVATRPWEHLTEADLLACFSRFTGEITQIPSSYSAIKVGGVASYKLARSGKEVAVPERKVRIHKMEFIRKDKNLVLFRAHCSKGTYIRTLCHDMGVSLGTVAHLSSLRRTRVGSFEIGGSVTMDRFLQQVSEGTAEEAFSPMDDVMAMYPSISVDIEREEKISHGNPIFLQSGQGDSLSPGDIVRLKNMKGGLIAIGKLDAERPRKIKIEKVLIH